MIKAKILVVDDDAMNLDIISATFQDSEFDIAYTDNGAGAVAFLDDPSVHYDLIVLDRMMPGMDGMDVLRRIKSTPRLMYLPVIMQTAAAAPDQVEEGLRAGAHYYLTKPYAPAALRTIVRAALEDNLRLRELEVRVQASGEGLHLARAATFRLRTLDEGAALARLLGTLCPDPSTAQLSIGELLCNAVEHGNLGITYAEKSELKRTGDWRHEVERRLELPDMRGREVEVSFERTREELCIRVTDQGKGFDWQKYLKMDTERLFDPNGRGIALARLFTFPDLRYENGGRTAVARIALQPTEMLERVAS